MMVVSGLGKLALGALLLAATIFNVMLISRMSSSDESNIRATLNLGRTLEETTINNNDEITIVETLPPAWKFPGERLMSEGLDALTGEPTFPIFAWTYTQGKESEYAQEEVFMVPDQLMVMGPFSECTSDSGATTKFHKNFQSQVTMQASSMSIGASLELDLMGGGGEGGGSQMSFGGAYSKSKKSMAFASKMEMGYSSSVETEAKSRVYEAKLLDLANAPFNPEFIAARDALTDNPSKEGLTAFMKKFGTHYYKEATFGGRISQTTFVTGSKVETDGQASVKKSSGMSFSLAFVDVTVNESNKKDKNTLKEKSKQSTTSAMSFDGGIPDVDWRTWCTSLIKIPSILSGVTAPVKELLKPSQRANWDAAYLSYAHCNGHGTWNPLSRACTCDDTFSGKFCDLQAKKFEVTNSVPAPGDHFVAWGNTECPSYSTIAYSGFAIGSHYNHAGSGSNNLCATKKQTHLAANHNNGDQNGGLVYHAEYQFGHGGLGTLAAIHDYEVPCAMCIVKDRHTFMQPGSITCPSGFELAYKGYLSAAHYQHKKSSWNCVDLAAEKIGTVHNHDGALFYAVETEQAVHGFPSYQVNMEVMCSQCISTAASKGPVYTRWGHQECPSGDKKIYTGWVGGPHYTHRGSGAQPLCMAPTATYQGTNSGDQNGGLIYRSEYQTGGMGLGTLTGLHDREVPCALCQAQDVSNVQGSAFMIPGKRNCPANTVKKYEGYLMGGHYTHQKLDYTCLDSAPQGVGSAGNEDGALFYPTEIQHIPGYDHDSELTCVQCVTKAMGSVYTRWGVRSCPTGSELIHNGMGAGPYHGHAGSGTNLLCLPEGPEYNDRHGGNQDGALLYRLEYVMNGYGAGSMTHLDHHEVGCSVCQATGATATFTVSGSYICPENTRREYYGQLMSAHYTHHKNSFICVDVEAETLGDGGHANHALIYPVESEMAGGRAGTGGSDWQMNMEVVCAVCSVV
eukprot:GFYU01000625.1.p1 GENE.GFYU01000625.1~~GFYU01000625.1.p1  ORF type:complete len:964 (-),score=240.40 GFYU01000625.1:75-2966(-)